MARGQPEPDFLDTLGAALYRAGRFEESIRRLEENIRERGGKSLPQDWVFLALAHHQLGHRAEALRWLDRFRTYKRMRIPMPSGTSWRSVSCAMKPRR